MGLHRTRKCPNCDNDMLEYDKWVDTLQRVKDDTNAVYVTTLNWSTDDSKLQKSNHHLKKHIE